MKTIQTILLFSIAIGVMAITFGMTQEMNEEPNLAGGFINDFSSVLRSTSFELPLATSTDTSVEIAPANVARQWMLISNDSTTTDMYLNFSSSPAATSSGILLSPQATFEININALYTGAIQAIGVATSTILVTEK